LDTVTLLEPRFSVTGALDDSADKAVSVITGSGSTSFGTTAAASTPYAANISAPAISATPIRRGRWTNLTMTLSLAFVLTATIDASPAPPR
jgi:hypothetical protein